MLVEVCFKTPDAVFDCVTTAVHRAMIAEGRSLMDDNFDDDLGERVNAEMAKFEKWIRHGEYLWVEFDTDNGTAEVKAR